MHILRLVMSFGFGFVITTGAFMMLCLPAYPFDNISCTLLTSDMIRAMNAAGFNPYLAGVVTTGSLIYVVTGAWKNN